MTGKVSLVGAGPGDPGLLTLKAFRRLQKADLIVYDTLVNPDHLRHARPDAQKICVGKGYRYKRLSQQKINGLILQSAKKGLNVVRLKGGDPYLFGRGGEEALLLAQENIPFEVVPGVTSATACAAYAGIPLTHREHNASVTFLTGHRAGDDDLDSVNWEKIVAIGGTLVIYMGFYNLSRIVNVLQKKGMSKETPIAVIQWGTLPRQKSVSGTLATIEAEVAQKKLSAPAIIVVGDVVSLGKKLNWFQKLPLLGKKVLITRMAEKTAVFYDRLSDLGAQLVELPVIEIKPITHFNKMDQAIRGLHGFDWLIFTSAYGVEAFFKRLAHFKKDARILSQVKVASVGPGTSDALAQHGVNADLVPPHYETSAIVSTFRKKFKNLNGKKILLLRADIAPPPLEKGLRKLGASVERVDAYKTARPVLPPEKIKDVKSQLMENKIDFVTFTSSSTVSHFVKTLGADFVKKVKQRTRFASIGPVTSDTLKAHGLKVYCQAQVFTVDGLIDAIIKK